MTNLRLNRGEIEALLASLVHNDKVAFATLEAAREKLKAQLAAFD